MCDSDSSTAGLRMQYAYNSTYINSLSCDTTNEFLLQSTYVNEAGCPMWQQNL